MNTILLITIAATVLISISVMNNASTFEKYKFNVGAILQRKEYLRLISAGFLHADFLHLLFNMYTLYIFSPIIINQLGEGIFLIIYFGAIIAGNLFSLYLYRYQAWYSAIGASGGVSGILFAAIALNPYLGLMIFPLPIQIPGFVFGLLYFGYSVYMMFNPRQGDNIGHAAHLGGAALGLLLAIMIVPQYSLENIKEILIMAIPLIYMAIRIFKK